ncbi:hypothetical protein SPONN_1324 [uncultured Candidatus Thioglobus sp.]|nr:hypothetical protein SPONN_1324 [uncultured Candidatus Thioglobus sp.]
MAENTGTEEDTKQYVLIWDMKFSVLEKFILKVIEKNQGCSDNDIAEILCLTSGDVSDITSDDGLKSCIQGDKSRRTLISNFTKKEFSIFDESKESQSLDNKKYCTKKHLDFLPNLTSISINSLTDELKKYKAGSYYELNKKYVSEWEEINKQDD